MKKSAFDLLLEQTLNGDIFGNKNSDVADTSTDLSTNVGGDIDGSGDISDVGDASLNQDDVDVKTELLALYDQVKGLVERLGYLEDAESTGEGEGEGDLEGVEDIEDVSDENIDDIEEISDEETLKEESVKLEKAPDGVKKLTSKDNKVGGKPTAKGDLIEGGDKQESLDKAYEKVRGTVKKPQELKTKTTC